MRGQTINAVPQNNIPVGISAPMLDSAVTGTPVVIAPSDVTVSSKPTPLEQPGYFGGTTRGQTRGRVAALLKTGLLSTIPTRIATSPNFGEEAMLSLWDKAAANTQGSKI